ERGPPAVIGLTTLDGTTHRRADVARRSDVRRPAAVSQELDTTRGINPVVGSKPPPVGEKRKMAKLTRLGELERSVMDHLWSAGDPQTVRQVYEALSARRELAYTTIMTVLQRLAKKNLVVQHRDDRAHRYAPTHGRDELVAGLMVDALDQVADSGSREAALVHFVERVGADEAAALRRALADLESKTTAHVRSGQNTEPSPASNPGTG